MEGNMKKALILAMALMVLFLNGLTVNAYEWWADYPYSPDRSEVIDRFSWDGRNHVTITWNNSAYTASAVEMDPDGVPVVHWWAKVYSTYYDLYYSYNGQDWYYYGYAYY